MTSRISALAAFAGLAVFGSIANAGLTTPGSLVVYPVFDNRLYDGHRNLTLFTITNTHPDQSVRVHFKYVNGDTCLITNKFRNLTPNDTFSAITAFDNPNQEQGYCFVYAVDSQNRAIKFDYLVASQVDLRGVIEDVDDSNFEFEPFVFKAAGNRFLQHGALTDRDNDGLRDFNGLEYEPLPELLHFPRFFGQSSETNTPDPEFQSDLVLINMTGGRAFTATVDFAIYNDNEEPLSAQYSFDCWVRVPLSGPEGVNNVFESAYLRDSTTHDVNEVFGAPANFPETGWFTIDGNVASSNIDILNPAILGILIENDRGENRSGGVVTPFGSTATQDNGDLLPIALGGDTDDIVP